MDTACPRRSTELRQHVELGAGQGDLVLAATDQACPLVDDEVADVPRRRGEPVGPSQQRRDASQQLGDRERLVR